jgi:hypothetical protein
VEPVEALTDGMSNAGAAALESARTNAEAAAAARVVFGTLRDALAHGLRAGGLFAVGSPPLRHRALERLLRRGREHAAARAMDRVWATPV